MRFGAVNKQTLQDNELIINWWPGVRCGPLALVWIPKYQGTGMT